MNDGEYASRKRHLSVCLFVCLSAGDVVSSAMEDRQDSCGLDAPTTTPVQPLPCDVDDQSASPRSPVKPEVDMQSARESPAVGLDASPGGDTCDAPTSPEQEEEQTKDDMSRRRRRLVSDGDDVTAPMSSSSYFGESHVTRLQSFVDSVAAADEVTTTTSWLRGGRPSVESVTTSRPAPASRSTFSAAVDEPLDLSLKPPARRPVDDISFPVPVMPPLYPLLACRESWIAHWAALAAASLQHSLLFPALAVTSQTGIDTTSGSGWMTSSSPHSSSSSSSSGGTKMATDGRRTALTAMESFVQSSFKPRQQRLLLPPSSAHDLSHSSTNRKRRRHLGAEVTSSGDEDGGSHEEKRKRADVTGNAKDASVSPRSDDLTSKRDHAADKRSPVTSLTRPEVNGDGGYLSCSTLYDGHDSTNEHPLVSLEKFVGVSAPLFRSSAAPPSAAASNGISSPVCRTAALPDGKTASDDSKMTSYGGDSEPEAVTSRSMRGDVVSGSLGRSFASAQSLLCCNL